MEKDKFYLYGVVNTETGKLVSNITNPRHKYWESEKRAQHALDSYNPNYMTSSYKIYNGTVPKDKLKVVKIRCEVED